MIHAAAILIVCLLLAGCINLGTVTPGQFEAEVQSRGGTTAQGK